MTVLSNGTRPETGSLLSGIAAYVTPKVTATKPRRARAGAAVRRWFQVHGRQVREGVVNTAAFGCADVAAYAWHTWAGLLATTVSVLVVHWSIERVGVTSVPDR